MRDDGRRAQAAWHEVPEARSATSEASAEHAVSARRRRDDGASIIALEGLVVAGILLGAVWFLLYTPLPGDDSTLETTAATDLAADALRVLETTPGDAGYTSRLDEYLTKALEGDATDLRWFLGRMLPQGVRWGVYVDNGVDTLTVAEHGALEGETVSSSVLYAPNWNFTHVVARREAHSGMVGDLLDLELVPVRNAYRDATVGGDVVFASGHETALVLQGRTFAVDDVPPQTLDLDDGYETPYDGADPTSWSGSEEAYDVDLDVSGAPPWRFLPLGGDVYRVHPDHDSPALDAWADSMRDHVVLDRALASPGDAVAISYDITAVPPAPVVVTREIRVHGPVGGEVVASATVASLVGTPWSWTVPSDALYGTYVVHSIVEFDDQVVHDLETLDVVRPGTDAPAPAVYRVVLALSFGGI